MLDKTDPKCRTLLAHLEEERAKSERNAPLCKVPEARLVNEGMAAAFRVAIAHTVAVCYGPDAVAAYLRDGTLPEATGGDYEAVLTAELTRLARSDIDPGAGSDVGDQVAVVMGVRDQRMRQMEEELVENTGVMQVLRRQRDEAEQILAKVREYLETSDDDGIRTRETVLRMLGDQPAEPAQRKHIGGNAEDCPGPSESVT
ncbi:hypothetical protein ACWDHW_08495 [Streptomyces melanosporofaciens]